MRRYFLGLLFVGVTAVALQSILGYYWAVQPQSPKKIGEILEDDGCVLQPLLKIREHGYTGYRCRENMGPTCYGPVQAYIDAFTLKFLPHEWLEGVKLNRYSGTPWYKFSEFPRVFEAIRVSRWVSALLVSLCLMIFAWWRGTGFVWAWIIGFSLWCFPAMSHARLGMKTDIPSLLFLMALFWFFYQALERVGLKSGFKWGRWAVVFGVVALNQRFHVLLPLGLFVGFYVLLSLFKKVSLLSLLGWGLSSFFAAAFTYLLLNPNAWVSMTEAGWFFTFINLGKVETSTLQRIEEWWNYALPHLWIYGLVLAGAYTSLKKPKNIFYFLVPLLLTVITWRSAFHEMRFYLPIVFWSLLLFIQYFPKLDLRFRGTLPLFFMVGLGWSYITEHGKDPAAYLKWNVPYWKDRGFNRDVLTPGAPWIADALVRAPSDAAEIPFDQWFTFDSLSEDPVALYKRVTTTWEMQKIKDARILVTCWQDHGLKDHGVSLPGQQWAGLTKNLCKNSERISEYIAPFESLYVPHYFVTANFVDLFPEKKFGGKRGFSQPLFEANAFNPRSMKGADEGIETWFSPLSLYQNTLLETTWKWKKGVTEISIPYESTCKDRGTLSAEIGKFHTETSLDVRADTCAQWPIVCRLKMENWWSKRVGPRKLVLKAKIPAGSEAPLIVQARGLDRNQCKIFLNNITVKGER